MRRARAVRNKPRSAGVSAAPSRRRDWNEKNAVLFLRDEPCARRQCRDVRPHSARVFVRARFDLHPRVSQTQRAIQPDENQRRVFGGLRIVVIRDENARAVSVELVNPAVLAVREEPAIVTRKVLVLSLTIYRDVWTNSHQLRDKTVRM